MTKLFAIVHRSGGTPDASNDDLRRDELDGFVWTCPVDKRLDIVQVVANAQALLGEYFVGARVFDDELKIFLAPSYPVFDEPTVDA